MTKKHWLLVIFINVFFFLLFLQLSTKLNTFMGYGAVVDDGYGASYNPKPNSIVFCLSAFHSCEHTATWRLARSLEESLLAMQHLLSTRPPEEKWEPLGNISHFYLWKTDINVSNKIKEIIICFVLIIITNLV